jgi:hypothetical protein
MRNRLYNITNAQVGLILVILAIAGLGFSMYAHTQTSAVNWWQWADGAFQNFGTEVIGAILTFGLIEVLVGNREQHRAEESQHQRDQLLAISELLQAKTKTQEERQPIIQRMRDSDLFKRAELRYANLSGADLMGANLQGVDLGGASLQEAELRHANLSGSSLGGANLSGADLMGANLSGSSLYDANLSGAGLLSVNLENVTWDHSLHDRTATLPDGIQWTFDTDMKRFTDMDHPEYFDTVSKIGVIRKDMGLDPIE